MAHPHDKIRKMIQTGILDDFEQIATHFGKHKLCAAVHMSFETLVLRISDPGTYRINELTTLSDLLGVDRNILIEMATRLQKKKIARKKKA